MSSTFSITGISTTATFVIDSNGYKDSGPMPREYAVKVVVDSESEYQNLLACQSWNIHVDRAPGGTSVWTDVASGPGEGTLLAEDLGLWSAVLTDVSGDAPLNTGGARMVGCKFLLTAVL